MRHTTDHETIKKWTEERGARPVIVRGTGTRGGVLDLQFPGWGSEQDFEPVPWQDWFAEFEAQRLALVHEDRSNESFQSSFFRLVSRDPENGPTSVPEAGEDTEGGVS